MTKEQRIEVVNEIIQEIAGRGRKFFSGKHGTAKIILRNNRLYMFNEYSGVDMFLHTKYGYPPKKWIHGGTLWGLTKDFISYIQTGEISNGKNGYGGLYSPHWGYSEQDMQEIINKAKSLNYVA